MPAELPKDPEAVKNHDLNVEGFKNVLDKILLNPLKPSFSIEGLEFEFELKWDVLEKLLDEYAVYKKDGEQIHILGLKSEQYEETTTSQSEETIEEYLTELENFFYRQHKSGTQIYGSVTLPIESFNAMNPKLQKALIFGQETGLVIIINKTSNKTITYQLHSYYRPGLPKKKLI